MGVESLFFDRRPGLALRFQLKLAWRGGIEFIAVYAGKFHTASTELGTFCPRRKGGDEFLP